MYFEQVIDFVRNYADKFHHAKEEDILFEAMLQNVDNMHCNPIPVMLHEHDDGREYIRDLENALNKNDVFAAIENARGYCFLLQNHIYKEDNVLYPMAEEALTNEQKQKVLDRYQHVEQAYFNEDQLKKHPLFFEQPVG